MLFEEFTPIIESWWNEYLTKIVTYQKIGVVNSGNKKILFPNILLVTEANNFYIAELIGANKEFSGLNIRKHKENSIYRYLNQFDDSSPDFPLFILNSAGVSFRFLCLAREADFKIVKNRFPFIELYQSRLSSSHKGRGSVFLFGEDFSSCCIENSVLVNNCENMFRCKNILELFIFKKDISKNEVVEFFENTTSGGAIKGIHTVSEGEMESLIIGGHLQSMYLFPKLRETTLGDFIRLHPDVIKKAFKTSHFVYEPYLKWIEHNGAVTDVAINPDLLVRRDDGFYDIYDFKTAVLMRKNITKGERRRRRFIDYVEEGVAQLSNYREYFDYPKNREFAKTKYGIEVKNPKLVLLVGSWENTNANQIYEACRKYKNVSIIDFDTFTHLFYGSN